MRISIFWLALLPAFTLLVHGCGGGSSGASSSSSAPITLSGQAAKGPIAGGAVCAYSLAVPRVALGCTSTDGDGNYRLSLAGGGGDMVLEVTGGTYRDEATGATVTLTTPLRTLVRTDGNFANVLITPLTELALAASQQEGVQLRDRFEANVAQLEGAFGFHGIIGGRPFAGSGADDLAQRAVLTALARRHNASGGELSATLAALQQEIGNCGADSAATHLLGSGVSAVMRSIKAAQPAACTNRFVIDGVDLDFTLLSAAPYPAAWAVAQQVTIEACSDVVIANWPFGAAAVSISTTTGTVALGGTCTSPTGVCISASPFVPGGSGALPAGGDVGGAMGNGSTTAAGSSGNLVLGTTLITGGSGGPSGPPGGGSIVLSGTPTLVVTAAPGASNLPLLLTGSNGVVVNAAVDSVGSLVVQGPACVPPNRSLVAAALR